MIIFEVEDYLIFNIYHMEGKLQKPVFVKVSSL
jgi:hypothetical protein